jgi:hypothetical protein
MVRMIGPGAVSCAGWTSGVTLPWYGVAMIVSSLAASDRALALDASGRRWNDRDQARRENRSGNVAN